MSQPIKKAGTIEVKNTSGLPKDGTRRFRKGQEYNCHDGKVLRLRGGAPPSDTEEEKETSKQNETESSRQEENPDGFDFIRRFISGSPRARSDSCPNIKRKTRDSLNRSTIDLTWDDEEQVSKKRRGPQPGDTEGKESRPDFGRKIWQTICKIKKEVHEMGNWDGETKQNVLSQLSLITTDETRFFLMVEQQKVTQGKTDTRKERDPLQRDMSTQVTAADIAGASEKFKRIELAREIREKCKAAISIEDWEQVCKLPWPEEAYNQTLVKEGNPLHNLNNDNLMLVLLAEEVPDLKGLAKQVALRYPESIDVESDGITEIIQKITISRRGHTEEKKSKICSKILANKNFMDLWYCATQIAEHMKQTRTNHLRIPKILTIDTDTFRKMLEIALRDSDATIDIFVPERKGLQTAERKPQNREAKYRSEAVIVKVTENTTFTDVLQNVKETVKRGNADPRINAIRKTKSGDVLITMQSGENSEELIKTISANENLCARKAGKSVSPTLILRNADSSTTQEEVLESVRHQGVDECNVKELKTTNGNTKAYQIRTNKEGYDTLVEKKELKVGITYCQISPWVEITRCYRCWGLGHTRNECRAEETREQSCYKCGQLGHIAKACEEEPYCVLCNKKGHVTHSGRCPSHRKEMGRARITRTISEIEAKGPRDAET